MKKTYIIISTNCDCCADLIARFPTKYIIGPKCPHCRKILGPMQWNIEDKIRAIGEFEALKKHRENIKNKRG